MVNENPAPKNAPVTIADQALQCTQKFKMISRKLQAYEKLAESGEDPKVAAEKESESDELGLEGISVSAEMMRDVWARFNIWTGNIGALNRDKKSLEHRLRHADVREEVLRRLKHLNGSLVLLWEIVSGERKQEVWDSTDMILDFNPGEFTDSEQDSELDSESEDDHKVATDNTDPSDVSATTGLFGVPRTSTASDAASTDLEEEEPQLMTESNELFVAIREALSGLFQLSMFIYKSTRRNKFARFTAEKGQSETQIDIRHAHDRFPFAGACGNEDLIERLGKANARRRQWLLYKRRHREKMAAGQANYKVDLETRSPVERPSKESRANFPMSIETPSSRMTDQVEPPQLSPFAPNSSIVSGRTALSSTVASTFMGMPKLEPDTDHDDLSSHHGSTGFSATTYSESVKGESEAGAALLVPQPPPDSANCNPFECPYCFDIITISGRTSWIKHVHSDLASYICTYENCSHPPFESRHQWFSHELEVHRFQWFCEQCPAIMASQKEFQHHLRENHPHLLQNATNLQALIARAARPVRTVPATECPLCDYNALLRERRRVGGIETGPDEPISLTLKHFRNHLGRHLEQLALFVLPRDQLIELPAEDLAEWIDESGNLKEKDETEDMEDTNEASSKHSDVHSAPAEDSPKRVEVVELGFPISLDAIIDSINEECAHSNRTSTTANTIPAAPELAMGWLPPMNFTPPQEDFEQDDDELIPRREDSMYGGDLFTPGWVRGYGKDKEGFCGRCEPGVWHNLEDGSYERNLVYTHGIYPSGIPLARPARLDYLERWGGWQGYCSVCEGFRTILITHMGSNWFRHCAKEHPPFDPRIPGAVSRDYAVPVRTTLNLPCPSDEPHIRDYHEMLPKKIRRRFSPHLRDVFKDWPQLVHDHRDSLGQSALHQAAEITGSNDILEVILRAAGDDDQRLKLINLGTPTGDTALMLAATQGNEDAIVTLLKANADVNVANNSGQTALDCAAAAGYPRICKLLIDAGADILTSRVFIKIQHHKIQAAEQTHTSNPQANDKTNTDPQASWTPLMLAAAQGDEEVVKSSLAADADIEATTAKDAKTALMLAAANAHYRVIDLLIDSGANVNATDAKGWTPLMLAVRDNNSQLVSQLLSEGADVNHRSPDGWTAIAEATYQSYHSIMHLLLDRGADTESRSMHDWTPLMHAAFKGDIYAVDLLLAAGADLEVTSQHDETALLLAAAGKHSNLCFTLLEAGCTPEPTWVAMYDNVSPKPAEGSDPFPVLGRPVALGWTPLMLACQNGLEMVVEKLLDKRVRCDPKSPYGTTAYEIAKGNGHSEIARMIEDHLKRMDSERAFNESAAHAKPLPDSPFGMEFDD